MSFVSILWFSEGLPSNSVNNKNLTDDLSAAVQSSAGDERLQRTAAHTALSEMIIYNVDAATTDEMLGNVSQKKTIRRAFTLSLPGIGQLQHKLEHHVFNVYKTSH